jgi:plasmid stabilization system protein ParE
VFGDYRGESRAVLTLRLDPKLRKQLDRLAEATKRSRSARICSTERVANRGDQERPAGSGTRRLRQHKELSSRSRSAHAVRIRWLRTALANLNAEAEYIARDNPAAAARMVATIASGVEHLVEHPATAAQTEFAARVNSSSPIPLTSSLTVFVVTPWRCYASSMLRVSGRSASESSLESLRPATGLVHAGRARAYRWM